MVELLRDRALHLGMKVAGVDHRDAGAEVEIALALDIPDLGAFGAVDEDRRKVALAARHGRVLALLPLCVADDFCLYRVLCERSAHAESPPMRIYFISR